MLSALSPQQSGRITSRSLWPSNGGYAIAATWVFGPQPREGVGAGTSALPTGAAVGKNYYGVGAGTSALPTGAAVGETYYGVGSGTSAASTGAGTGAYPSVGVGVGESAPSTGIGVGVLAQEVTTQATADAYTEVLGVRSVPLAAAVAMAATTSFRWGVNVHDGLAAGVSVLPGYRAFTSVASPASVADAYTLAFPQVLAEALSAATTLSRAFISAAVVAESLVASGAVSSQARALGTVAAAIVALAESGNAWGRNLVESVSGSDTASVVQALVATLEEQVAVSTETDYSFRVLASVTEGSMASAEASPLRRLLVILQEGVPFAATLQFAVSADEVYDAWVVNTETFAGWKYENYPFNSFAFVGGRYYGMTDTGLYELEGDTDAGTPIDARIRTGLVDLGSRELKNVPRAYIGYTSDGELLLRATAVREGRKNSSYYKLAAHDVEAPDSAGAAFKREAISAYWQFDLENVDGADFALHDLEIYWTPVNLRRRT